MRTSTLSCCLIMAACSPSLAPQLDEDVASRQGGARDTSRPFTQLLTSSQPHHGVAAAISADGDRLFQSQGDRLISLDLATLRDAEVTGDEVGVAALVVDEVPLYAPVMGLHDAGDDGLWVAGGDHGLFRVRHAEGVFETVQQVDVDGAGRWCSDVVPTQSLGEWLLVTLWSGHDANEVRVYDAQGLVRAVIPVDVASGLTRAATAWAIDVAGPFAYVAAGSSGVVRVPWERAVYGQTLPLVQGPLAGDPSWDDEVAWLARARDLVVEEGHVYVAAEAHGLVSLRVDDPWGPSMPREVLFGDAPVVDAYPTRVVGHTDASGVVTLGVAVAATPSARTEWGPYASYANFTWSTGPYAPGVDALDGLLGPTDFERGSETRMHVLERVSRSAALTPVADTATSGQWSDAPAAGTLAMQAVGSEHWIFTQAPVAWRAHTRGGQRVLTRSDAGAYTAGYGGYASGVQSRVDPSIILAGADAGNHAIQRLEGSPLRLTPLEGTDDGLHELGLWVYDSWVTGETTEWVVGGQAGERWQLSRVVHDGGGVEVSTWGIPVGLVVGDDQATDPFGYDPRSYTSAALDPSSGLVVLARSQARAGLVVTTRGALIAAALATPTPGVDESLPLMVPDVLDELVLHEEAPLDGSVWPVNDDDHLYTFETSFFRNARGRKTLGVAAGTYVDAADPNYQRPKLRFYDMVDYTPGMVPDSATLLGSPGPAHAASWDIFERAGRQLLLLADTSGSVSLHDISELPEVMRGVASPESLEPLSVWQMAPGMIDGRPTVCSSVVARAERVGQRMAQRAYVACNRSGVHVLEVQAVAGDLQLIEVPDARLSTAYQALTVQPLSLGQRDALMVHDHGGGMSVWGAE